MSHLFDDITRLTAVRLPWWRTVTGLFGLLTSSVVIGSDGDRAERADQEREDDGQSAARETRPPREEVRRAYFSLVEQERHASELVAALDDHIESMTPQEDSLADWHTLHAGDRELFVLDFEMNEGFSKLYAAAAEPGDFTGDPVALRTALLHWTVLLRRRSMQRFHTRVEGLDDDPDCAGDIIVDQLLLRYFDTLFGARSEVRREVAAARALADLARQTACLGAQQSALLASNLYWSFVELRSFLRLNGLERIVPYVAQAAAGPLLLFHDVEKYRGPQAPLARWFAENYQWLIAGAETGRIPLTWHGLWLYDRRTGHLIGYRPVAEPVDENDVHLATFFASIISRENLGMYDCSFSEMIERGVSPLGYLCAGSVCAGASSKGVGSMGNVGVESARGKKTGGSERLKTAASTSAGHWSTSGSSADMLAGVLCGHGTGNGSGGRGGRGGRICGDGVSGFGRSWGANMVACLSQQIVRPGEQGLRCMAEALGACASPLDKAAKGLQQTLFAGVKMGKQCQLAKKPSGGSSVGNSELIILHTRTAGDKTPPSGDSYGTPLKVHVNTYGNIVIEFEDPHGSTHEIILYPSKGSSETGASQNGVEITPEELNERAEQLKAQGHTEEVALHLAQQQLAKEKAQQKEAENKQKEAENREGAGSQQRCPPDTPDCGGNDCTGMTQQMAAVMGCVSQQLHAQDLHQLRPIDLVWDPSPLDDTGSAPAWANCIGGFDSSTSSVQKQCWAVDCGPQNSTIRTQAGSCGCGPRVSGEPGPQLNGMCHHVDCLDGTPTVRNGMCTCAGGSAGGTFGVGTGTPPAPPFKLGGPRLFSEMRMGDLRPTGGSPNINPRTTPAGGGWRSAGRFP